MELQELKNYYNSNQDLCVTDDIYNELELLNYTGYERDLAYNYITMEEGK